VKWIHFLDADGGWKDIDCILKQVADGFEVTDAPFRFKAPLFADEEAFFESNCRWDIFEKSLITDAPFTQWLRSREATHVAGELYDLNANGRVDSVIYRNCFPALGNADLIYFVHHGRAPRLQKLVRFNVRPGGVDDVTVSFDVRFSRGCEIQEKKNGKRQKWAGNQKIKTKDSLVHKPSDVVGNRGVGMKDFFIWDSASPSVKQRIDVEYEKSGNSYILTKILPRAFLDSGTLPIWTDTTSTFYPDPHAETTTVDGYVREFTEVSNTWAQIHDDTDGDNADDSGTTVYAEASAPAASNDFRITRMFILFDTSSIPDGDSIASANVQLYVLSKSDQSNDAYGYGTIVGNVTPASNTSIQVADYDQCGSISNPTKMSSDVDITNMTTSAYNTFTMNSTGRSNISLTGITKWGFRLGHDIENVAPAGTKENQVDCSSADTSGTSQDPKLTVDHGTPPTAPSGLSVASADNSQTLTVSWTDNSSDETGFEVERSNDGVGGWSLINTTSAGATSYADNLGAWSTQRYYRVRAVNSYGNSAYTSVGNAKTAPQAPTAGTCTATSNSNNLTVTWTDNSSDESSFRIERSNDGVSGWSEINSVSAGVQTFTDSTIGARDTTRYYRVRAKRDSDTRYSGYTANMNATTAPADPSSLAVSPGTGGTTASISWTDNSTTESTFSIERMIANGSFSQITTSTTSPYADSGLTQEAKYSYRVRAYRASDGIYSGYTATVTKTMAAAAPTSCRALPSNDVTGAVKVVVMWDKNSLRETGFLVEKSLDNNSWSTAGTSAAGETQYEVSSLTVNTTYYFRVSAVGPDVNSTTAASGSIKTSMTSANALELAFLKKVNSFPKQ
jgi:hypothetical protein